jgi:hypothetical protein
MLEVQLPARAGPGPVVILSGEPYGPDVSIRGIAEPLNELGFLTIRPDDDRGGGPIRTGTCDEFDEHLGRLDTSKGVGYLAGAGRWSSTGAAHRGD